MKNITRTLGARHTDSGNCAFNLWAPLATSVDVHLLQPRERLVPMEKRHRGYFSAEAEDVPDGSRYLYRIDGEKERPDPASRFQPEGVHGPSEVMGEQFDWDEGGWSGLPLEEYIVYELHVGAFTSEGTFDAVVPHLGNLKELGITAVELMPVAQFPGNRNWGYDGTYPFAVQNSYGGPAGLKRLVNACHRHGLSVILDVVYNHLGPEGNYLHDYAPYFTDRYKTPWGSALNFDGAGSDEVRRFFIENALHWIVDFHVDALRLDAVHTIFDFSAYTFLEALVDSVRDTETSSGHHAYVIAESNQNDVRLISPRAKGGYDLDATWNDDLHHALHVLLTGERDGYYMDFGQFSQLPKAYREGFVYSGQYSQFRKRSHGSAAGDVPGCRFVVCAQNHDQVGNRLLGERLGAMISFEDLKLAAGAVLLSPFIPLLFMGEEYGETAPFQYFISHTDPELVEAVRRGRRAEFSAFYGNQDFPDPQSAAVFAGCKLDHSLKDAAPHAGLYRYYGKLIQLRKQLWRAGILQKKNMEVIEFPELKVFSLRYRTEAGEAVAFFNFETETASIAMPSIPGRLEKKLDSSETLWGGPGSVTSDRPGGADGGQLAIARRTCLLFTGNGLT